MLVFYFEMARNRNAICINCIIELLQKMHRLIKLVCAIFAHCKFLKKEKTRRRCYATGVDELNLWGQYSTNVRKVALVILPNYF